MEPQILITVRRLSRNSRAIRALDQPSLNWARTASDRGPAIRLAGLFFGMRWYPLLMLIAPRNAGLRKPHRSRDGKWARPLCPTTGQNRGIYRRKWRVVEDKGNT